MSMVEKVALAISHACDGGNTPKSYWEGVARTAIEAMREPTEAMLSAPYTAKPELSAILGHALPSDDAARLYTIMIDAALAEGTDAQN